MDGRQPYLESPPAIVSDFFLVKRGKRSLFIIVKIVASSLHNVQHGLRQNNYFLFHSCIVYIGDIYLEMKSSSISGR